MKHVFLHPGNSKFATLHKANREHENFPEILKNLSLQAREMGIASKKFGCSELGVYVYILFLSLGVLAALAYLVSFASNLVQNPSSVDPIAILGAGVAVFFGGGIPTLLLVSYIKQVYLMVYAYPTPDRIYVEVANSNILSGEVTDVIESEDGSGKIIFFQFVSHTNRQITGKFITESKETVRVGDNVAVLSARDKFHVLL